MATRRLVQSRIWCGKEPSGEEESLSSEFFAQVRQRLGILCLIFAGTLSLALILNHSFVYLFDWEHPLNWNLVRGSHFGLLLLCLGVYAATRSQSFCDRALPQLGIVFELLGALLLALPAYSGTHLLQDNMGRLPWVAVWILLFPLVIPIQPRRGLIVSLLAASTCPLVLCTWIGFNAEIWPEWRQLAHTFLPVYIAAVLAIVPAYMISYLGTRVSAAEDRAKLAGSYRLIELLGKGGMGEVWRAEHQIIARPAAVKLISPDSLHAPDVSEEDRQVVMARFEREAKTTSTLRSPHTIALYDFGVGDDGALYYVMELLEGIDLESLVLRFGPLSPARTVSILTQVCSSLAEAHKVGLVHRDIKPANVALCKLGFSYDFVKVLDFGLVGLQPDKWRAGATQDARLTEEGFLLGTPAFVSPEMVEGKAVDGRADLYAVGCIAYWLLTGEFVFEEESAIKMLLAHVKTPPAPLSERTKEAIPAELEELILRCLAKKPADRPASAMELAGLLQNCSLPDTWTQADAQGWWTENGKALEEIDAPEEGKAETLSWPSLRPYEPETAITQRATV